MDSADFSLMYPPNFLPAANGSVACDSVMLPDPPGSTAQDHLTEAYTLGRKISRSSAFLTCLSNAAVVGAYRPAANNNNPEGGHFGPYVYCDGTGGDTVILDDPIPGESLSRQAARLASASVSRLQTDVKCYSTNECAGGSACTNDVAFGANEVVKWETQSFHSVKYDAFLAWHEVGHALGYEHDNCSYEPAQDPGAHSGPNILGKCVDEVEKEIDASSCAALSCASNELAVPKLYGNYGPGDPCECVPDSFQGENEAGDYFGSAFAVGDFDGDFFPDLAVGAFGESSHRGVVYLFRGGRAGLRFWKRLAQSQLTGVDYDMSTAGFSVGQNINDEFGYALGAGDFNADGFADLLIGAPGKNSSAGVVYLLPGAFRTGPDLDHVEWIDQTDTGGAVEAGDRFGSAIVVGNFDANSTLDFAIGAPAEVAGGFSGGAVSLHRGRAGVAGTSTFENSDGIWTFNENGAEFGFALAAADVDGDGRDEIVVGAPGTSLNNGQARILEKDSSAWADTQTIVRSATRFGSTIAAGDFISDSNGDIAVGAGQDQGKKGSVFTFRGTSATVVYAQTITSDETDRFGEGLAIGNVVGGSKRDLLVGLPGEAVGNGPAEGQIYIYGATTGTTLGGVHTILTQGDFFDAGAGDTVLPPEHRGADSFGSSIIMYSQVDFPVSKLGVVAGAYSDTIDGVKSGAAFVYFGTHADRKLDQVTMRHADSLPYAY